MSVKYCHNLLTCDQEIFTIKMQLLISDKYMLKLHILE